VSLEDFSKRIAAQVLSEIKREDMPQVGGGKTEDVVNVLENNGVLVTREKISPTELESFQDDYSSDKVDSLKEKIRKEGKVRTVFVSEDYKVVDGHHRAIAATQISEEDGANVRLPIVRVHLSGESAVEQVRDAVNKVNENTDDLNHVVVYSGVFQPFHKEHYNIYENLVEKFGVHNVYLATSNRTNESNPLSFSDKRKVMTRMYPIPEQQIHEVENSWNPTEVLEGHDEEETVFVAALGESDVEKLKESEDVSDLFEEYDSSDLKPYKEQSYYYEVEDANVTIKETSVEESKISKIFSSSDVEEKTKKQVFKELFGSFDETVFSLINDRFDSKIVQDQVFEKYLKETKGNIGGVVKKTKKMLSEASTTSLVPVDDGPTTWWHNQGVYEEYHEEFANKIGWEFLDDIGKADEDQELKTDGLPFDSFYPTGASGSTPVENPETIYYPFVDALASGLGYEIIDYLGSEIAPNYEPSTDPRDEVEVESGRLAQLKGQGGAVETVNSPSDRVETIRWHGESDTEVANVLGESIRRGHMKKVATGEEVVVYPVSDHGPTLKEKIIREALYEEFGNRNVHLIERQNLENGIQSVLKKQNADKDSIVYVTDESGEQKLNQKKAFAPYKSGGVKEPISEKRYVLNENDLI
jgi:nicotinamide mononucleotide adenylyltransferase